MLQITFRSEYEHREDKWGMSTSLASPYTPILVDSYKTGEYFEFGEYYSYYKPVLNSPRSTYYFNISDLYNILNRYLRPIDMYIDQTESLRIKIMKGCIFDHNNKILLMLSHKANKKIHYHDSSRIPTKENGQNMKLFISTELMFNPLYKVLYEDLLKNYIQEACKIDIPVVYTTSAEIEKLHFSNDFKIEFNTIDSLQHHLNNVVGTILGMEEEDFRTFHPGIIGEPVIQEESPVELNPISEVPPNPFPRESLRERLRRMRSEQARQEVDELFNIPPSPERIMYVDPVSPDSPVGTSMLIGTGTDNVFINGSGYLSTGALRSMWDGTTNTISVGDNITLIDDVDDIR